MHGAWPDNERCISVWDIVVPDMMNGKALQNEEAGLNERLRWVTVVFHCLGKAEHDIRACRLSRSCWSYQGASLLVVTATLAVEPDAIDPKITIIFFETFLCMR